MFFVSDGFPFSTRLVHPPVVHSIRISALVGSRYHILVMRGYSSSFSCCWFVSWFCVPSSPHRGPVAFGGATGRPGWVALVLFCSFFVVLLFCSFLLFLPVLLLCLCLGCGVCLRFLLGHVSRPFQVGLTWSAWGDLVPSNS